MSETLWEQGDRSRTVPAMSSLHIPGGMLIAVEGIDGAGKTTVASALREWLIGVGAAVSYSKEPTTGQWGRLLRESAATGRMSPEKELEYLVLDRMEHVRDLIQPALGRGEFVVLDRYFPSNVAYQGAAGIPVDALLEANRFAPTPDVLLLLDVDVATGLSRIRARGDEPNHFETTATLQRCREIFLGLSLPGLSVIDASADASTVLASAQLAVLRCITERARKLHGTSAEAVDMVGDFMPPLTAHA